MRKRISKAIERIDSKLLDILGKLDLLAEELEDKEELEDIYYAIREAKVAIEGARTALSECM